MTDYDEFEAWSTPKSRKKRKKDAKRVNVYPRLAGGIDEIPQMLGKEPLAAEDRPEEERMTRERAEALAGEILGWLEPVTDYAEVAGSYRRGRQDPGDLDVIVILKNRVKLPEIAELWLAEGKASAVNWVGEKKTQLLIDGVKVDIRTSTPRALGAALLYFTGPAGYNIGIRSAAKRAGFKLSEYGLFNRETGEYIAGATEEEIYTAMGRNYRPPTERRAEEEVITRSLGEIPDKELIILYQQGKISKMQMEIGFGLKMDAESYKPPASAISAAKRGLEQRKKYGRGGLSPAEAKSQGIDSGVTRARKIASGKVSKHDVRRMSAFNRHRKNNNPGKKMPDGGPTAGTIAWNLWGGTSGVNWAKKKSAAMNAEDMNAETLDYNSFTNDMEALLAKYSQLLLTYETEYQDGIMEVFTRFKPYDAYFDDVDFNAETFEAETQEFADRFEIQIRTSRGNTTERIPVGGSMLVRRLREILGRNRQPYAIDVFGTEAAFNVQGPYGMQVYRPTPKLLAVYKYGRFESGEMADHLNEKLGLNQFAAEGSKVFEAPTCLYCDEDEDGRYAEIDDGRCSCDFCFHCGEHTYDGYELKAPYPSLHPDVRLCDACYAIPNFPISGKIWAYENYRGLATPNIYDFNQGRGWARWEHPNYQKYAKGHMGRKGKLMNELNRRVPQRTDGWVNWTRDKFEEEFRIYPWHYGYDANREPRWAYDKSEIEDRINEFYQQG